MSETEAPRTTQTSQTSQTKQAPQAARPMPAPLDRVDGVAKVTGQARYCADHPSPGLLHAALVTSTIAAGEIEQMDIHIAEAMPGVHCVMTPFNAPRLPEGGKAAAGQMPAGRVLTLLQDTTVHYNNQPIGVVVADTLARALEAARHVKVRYRERPAVLDFGQARSNAYAPDKAKDEPADTVRGDMEAGLRDAAAIVDAVYTTPLQHHNPMEPHATVAAWDGDLLTLYDATQYVSGVRQTVAKTLGIPLETVRVICPYVGGGFGGKGSVWSHVVLAAMAARKTGRAVRLALERPQMFGEAGARPHTEQRMVLAANTDGTLRAVRHTSLSSTSFLEDWLEPAALPTRMLYRSDALETRHRLLKLNMGTPTFMRAPGDASGSFALESALDELAWRLGIDPIELRLRNDTGMDLGRGLPFSSRPLRECFRIGAERFDWSRRAPEPGTMRDGDKLVGMGVATATYPAMRQRASAVVSLLPDGTLWVRSGTQDLGTGSYTMMVSVAAEAFGLSAHHVRAELGDTQYPEAPVSGGSQSVASVAPAVQEAATAVRQMLIERLTGDPASPLCGAAPDDIDIVDGTVFCRSAPHRRETVVEAARRQRAQTLTASATTEPGDEKEHYSMHSFGAVFAEVEVDADLGEVRVRRMLGSYAVGRLLSPKTGRSQLYGGLVWGIGFALHERSDIDPRCGRIVNGNLAEYHVPVNADVGEIEVLLVNDDDRKLNRLGARGVGEIGIVGAVAAIANAVYHATGKRIRDLPITPDKLLG